MFFDIGRKIKGLATFIAYVGIIGSIMIGFLLLVLSKSFSYNLQDLIITIGFLIMIIGPITSWIASFLLYGYGELIDKVTQIDNKMNIQINKQLAGQQRIEALQTLLREGKITLEEYQEAVRNG